MQEEIIQSLLAGRDCLVLMPTGGGKSVCYQIPAVITDGVALVVSPLIALMKDQVEGLTANGIASAYINSSQDYKQVAAIETQLLEGRIKLLYVSPEKLVSQNFQPLLKRLKISFIAIDEAHCISQWGHDFRPEYTQLKFLKTQFPHTPFIALTATADKVTRRDILEQLGFSDPAIFVASFDRPNLKISVKPGLKRIEQIAEFLKTHPNQSGIIYCLARKTCEELAMKLNQRGFKAAFYHAEIPPAARAKVQDDFIHDRIPIICATIAFGMGIDKSNVRFVLHYNLPRNVEGYYQEIGRSGRDGLPAETILYYSYNDLMTYRDMILQSEGDDVTKQLKIAKLDRMYDFAEAKICRRKTILSYFGEERDYPCGSCDNCLHPPKNFDGTIVVQKALSALLRLQEKVGMGMLIDVLRGSGKREIFENKYNTIKTYGAGREYSHPEWMYFLAQMLHLGLIEIAYDRHHVLQVTNAGKAVLFDDKKVALAIPVTKAEKEVQAAAAKPKSITQLLRDELLEVLMQFRRKIGLKKGLPPYQIFSDATIQEMAENRPVSAAEMLHVNGVTEHKLEQFGWDFIQEIRRFVMEKIGKGMNVPGSTALLSLVMFNEGNAITDIAQTRGLSPTTILGHLAVMYEKGEPMMTDQWVSEEEVDLIGGALSLFKEPYQLKEIGEHFGGRFSFEKIRWALASVNRRKAGFSL